MTATLTVARGMRDGALAPRPHVARFFVALASHLGCAPKTAEKQFAVAVRVNNRAVAAARASGDPSMVGRLFDHADASRKIEGAPLTCDSAFACLINRDVLAESQCLAEFVADRTQDERTHLLKHSKKLAGEIAELIAALEAMC